MSEHRKSNNAQLLHPAGYVPNYYMCNVYKHINICQLVLLLTSVEIYLERQGISPFPGLPSVINGFMFSLISINLIAENQNLKQKAISFVLWLNLYTSDQWLPSI